MLGRQDTNEPYFLYGESGIVQADNVDEVILDFYLRLEKLRQVQGAQEKVFEPY